MNWMTENREKIIRSILLSLGSLWFLLVVLIRKQEIQTSYYNVIGSRVVRPNSEYHCAISIQATSEPTRVTTSLQGISRNGSVFSVEDVIEIQPYTSRMCRLEIGDLGPGDYKLEVQGTGGVDFHADFPLEYLGKSYSVFIQTDRAIYKPGTKISFRVIVLNSQLKPAAEVRNEPLHVYISDGKGDIVKEWKNVEAIRGVFSEELLLAKAPVLGDWKISVEIHGQVFDKTIKVAEYILPKFKIEIDVPKHMTFDEGFLVANIEARYNYGKDVQGEATVTVFPTFYSGVIQPVQPSPVRKVIPINGKTQVEFDIENELKLSDEFERIVVVDVVIEELETGRRQNNSVEVHIHKYPYNMELIKTADYFKPGLPYIAYVKITNHDGTPIKSKENDVIVRHGYSRVDEVYKENHHTLDKNGLIMLAYTTPIDVTNTTALRIEAEYRGLKERISPIPAAVSFSNTFLQISLLTEKPVVNLDVKILVRCTEPMRYINYVLMGRGDVLIANTFQIERLKEYHFHFTATHAMVPIAHLIVSYVRDDGELIGDSLDIEIDGLLQNFIDIQIPTVESEPSRDMEITVLTKPNSYVGLLAVDEQVLKMRSGFDLSRREISKELQKYDIAPESPFAPIMKDSKYHFFWKPGSSNPHSAIYESGADIITNAHINRHKPTLMDIYLRPVFYGSSTVKPDRGFGIPLHPVTRPPLAGPYAFSRIPRPVWNRPKVYLNDDVADTWIFTNFLSGYDGKTSLRRKIPSTLNTWIITGFSLDPLNGLGFITNPKILKVSKSFVVSLDLPYSVQRGEILAVPIVVFNHGDQDITAEVTLHNPDNKFEFAEISNEVNATRKVELYRRKRISVEKNRGETVTFMITPLKLGSVEIKVTASNPRSQDVAVKNLFVTPNGEPEHYTKTVLIDLRKQQSYKGNITFTIPKNAVPGSEKIEISAVGDLLGSMMINLENLIHLPTSCGEQNLINFIPNLIILNYLRRTKQLTPAIEKEAIKLLEMGYQQQLAYKRDDGSFSAFGSRDANGSIWVTAYTALALRQAKPFIYIDMEIVKSALGWLEQHQYSDGSFYEIGSVIHENMQSRDGSSLALTAFTVLAFIENQNTQLSYTNVINKGLDYIARNIDASESTYTIAICSYVLQISKHVSMESAFNLLIARTKYGKNRRWWAEDTPKNEEKNPWNKLPKSKDIETTAYALLTLAEANYVDDMLQALDWLLDQQNELGGFTSSQDTVISLYAISKVVSRLSGKPNVHIEFTKTENDIGAFNINANNAMILQKVLLPIQHQNNYVINFTATGTGLAIFRVSYQYNMNVTGPWPLFTLDPQVDKNSDFNHLQLSICTAFVSRTLTKSDVSDMAVMEVSFPSGFTADIDALPSLEVSQNAQKVEARDRLSKVVLYFNNITRREYCPTVSAYRTHKVANQKPVPVIVYDYYDSSRRARVFYNGPTATLCDICDDEDCGDICVQANKQKSGEVKTHGESGGSRTVFSYCIVMFVLITARVFN